MSDQTWAQQIEDATAFHEESVDETTIVPGYAPTDFVPIAWSREHSDVDTVVAYRESHTGTAVWAVALVALLVAGVATVWFGLDFYREREPSAAPVPPTVAVQPPAPKLAPPPAPAPKPVAPPVAPPTTPVPDPGPEIPPVANVNARTIRLFRSLLAADGMHIDHVDTSVKNFAENLCEDAAYGHLREPTFYLGPSPGNGEPPNFAEHGVRDALRAFCPQYESALP